MTSAILKHVYKLGQSNRSVKYISFTHAPYWRYRGRACWAPHPTFCIFWNWHFSL